jgi:hypothetical protein
MYPKGYRERKAGVRFNHQERKVVTIMGLNIDKLKNNLARLRKEAPKRDEKRVSMFWTPGIGEHQVYLLPWQDQPDYPFKEYWMYYSLKGKGKDENGRWPKPPLALKQFGEEKDPVQEMISELLESGEEADKKLAQKLFATQVIYVPVIVKGEEELGPRLWKFTSKLAYESLTEMFIKSERYGIMNDPENERWVEIVVSPENKPKPMDKKITKVDPAWENEPLSEDPDQIAKWLENVPDPMRSLKYQRLSYDALKEKLIQWANSTSDATDEQKDSDGTERGGSAPKKEEVEEKAAPAPKKRKGRKKKDETVSADEARKKLDDFYNDDEEDDDED